MYFAGCDVTFTMLPILLIRYLPTEIRKNLLVGWVRILFES